MTRPHSQPLRRRTLLRTGLLTGVVALTTAQAGCAPSDPEPTTGDNTPDPDRTPSEPADAQPEVSPSGRSRGASPAILLAYFSRPGENYYYGDRIDLEVGNTEVLANMLTERIDCDVYRIEAADPYSDDYDATVERNTQEQDADARPAIANPLPSLNNYDVVLLASPIWSVRPPMIMKTFAEALDFTGKTVHPITTHAMSGLGNAEQDHTDACPGATLGQGLAIQGEKVADSDRQINDWLSNVDLPTR